MPYSKIDSNKMFDEKIWIVSVLNTGKKWGGHAMLVIEGIKKDPNSLLTELFVGQYDITAIMTEEQDSSFLEINTKGYINQVRCFESNAYKKDYSNYPAKSYFIDSVDAKKMIASIKNDKEICDKAQNESEYPRYQFVGTKHFLSQINMGHNCASWCCQKLQEGGIEVFALTSKPKKLTSNCIIS